MSPAPARSPSGAHGAHSRVRDLWPHLRPYRWRVALAVLIGLLAAGATLLQPLYVSQIVDQVSTEVRLSTILVLALLFVSGAVLGALRQVILERCGEDFVYSIRRRLIDHVLRLPMAVLQRTPQGDLLARVTTDTNTLRNILSQGIIDLLISTITVTVSVAMMLVLDATLAGLVLIALLLVLAAMVLITKRSRPASFQLQSTLGMLSATMARTIGSIPLIRSAVATEHESQRAGAEAASAREVGYRLAWLRAIAGSFSGVAVQVLLLAVVGLGALRVASGATTIGSLSAFLMYMMMVTAPVAAVSGVLLRVGEALGAFTRIDQILATPVEQVIVAETMRPPLADEVPGAVPRHAFELQDLTFSHDGSAVPSIRNLSLAIPAQQFTAIVGASGAGKTTLLQLLERFYDIDSGQMFFYGEDVTRIRRDDVRRRVAYVEQGAPALSGTVAENLRLGAPLLTDEECLRALCMVNLCAPGDGVDALGREVGEGGVLLSGGERQRLAIARALLRDSDVILLDEATSNLDSENERRVQDALMAVRSDRTLVVIAHRLATVAAADSIIVLDHGEAIASGTHHSLLEDCPLYRALASHQLLGIPG